MRRPTDILKIWFKILPDVVDYWYKLQKNISTIYIFVRFFSPSCITLKRPTTGEWNAVIFDIQVLSETNWSHNTFISLSVLSHESESVFTLAYYLILCSLWYKENISIFMSTGKEKQPVHQLAVLLVNLIWFKSCLNYFPLYPLSPDRKIELVHYRAQIVQTSTRVKVTKV